MNPRRPPSPAVFTVFGMVRTVVGVFGGFVVGNETTLPPRCATNQRDESPGICAMCIGVPRVTLLKTRTNFTVAVPGGRAGATQVGLAGRVSRP